MAEKTKVEFWFDPTCPWTWVTAKWMKEVEKVRDIEIKWNPFSLYFLNEGRDLPEGYRKHIDQTIGVPRVVLAVRELAGQDKVEEFYFVLGKEIHDQGNNGNAFHDALVAALEKVGLPADYVEFEELEDYDDALKASTQAGLDKVGDEVGVPIVSLNDTAFFGPVITPAPKGEEAGKVFDGAVALASYPGFYELKRSRTGVKPDFS
ncbi:mycothiol-dependent nitroreductase Rv2466c family protein [Rothia aerolata]|uniref:DSBA oxidoreductase n=1 Tax=Rothia aerolata TaxID=1812262 RepID=A0A917ILT5_9MICC|nr:DsbA family protein [Rothia aerolata]GGH58287.1 DSBA oxidoreductase [Rothia aerolata]